MEINIDIYDIEEEIKAAEAVKFVVRQFTEPYQLVQFIVSICLMVDQQ